MSSISYLKSMWNSDRGEFILDMAKYKTKKLSLNSDDSDFYYAFIQVGQYILTYCNRLNIPTGLDALIPQMIVDALKHDWYTNLETGMYSPTMYGANFTSQGNISSVKEGDTAVTYSSSSNGSDGGDSLDSHTPDLDAWLYNYNSQLQKYRQLYKI